MLLDINNMWIAASIILALIIQQGHAGAAAAVSNHAAEVSRMPLTQVGR